MCAQRSVRTDRHFPLPHSLSHTKLKSPCGTGAPTGRLGGKCALWPMCIDSVSAPVSVPFSLSLCLSLCLCACLALFVSVCSLCLCVLSLSLCYIHAFFAGAGNGARAAPHGWRRHWAKFPTRRGVSEGRSRGSAVSERSANGLLNPRSRAHTAKHQSSTIINFASDTRTLANSPAA